MIYNNLIYFLVVIFALSTDTAPDAARIGPIPGFLGIFFLYFTFSFLCDKVYRKASKGSAGYFSAEKKLSLSAVFLFVFLFHFVDLKYYLHPLSLDNRLPVLENIGGIFFFYLFLVLMWQRGRLYYLGVFQRFYSPLSFVISNTKTNLPIILPWLVLSLVFDLLASADIPKIQQVLNTPACASALRPQSVNSPRFNCSARGKNSSPNPASAAVTSPPDSSSRAIQAL